MENIRMANAASSFCNDITAEAPSENYFRSVDFPFLYNGGLDTIGHRDLAGDQTQMLL